MKKITLLLTLLLVIAVVAANAVALPMPVEAYQQNPQLANGPNPTWAVVIVIAVLTLIWVIMYTTYKLLVNTK